MSVIQEVMRRLLDGGLASPGDIRGCTPEEIEAVQVSQGVALPVLYKEFLHTMGRGAGQFLRGTDAFFPELLHLREWALELLEEDGATSVLSADAFVFLSHQGYQFMYFIASEGDDPPVYHYIAKARTAEKRRNAFSDWLLSGVGSQVEARKKVEGWRKKRGPR